jgi:hypothetical protein
MSMLSDHGHSPHRSMTPPPQCGMKSSQSPTPHGTLRLSSPSWTTADSGNMPSSDRFLSVTQSLLSLPHSSSSSFSCQTVIELTSYPSLYQRGHKVELISVPMELYSIPARDATGKDVAPIGTPPSSTHALLWCSIRLPPLSQTMCGWVWRIPGRYLASLSRCP